MANNATLVTKVQSKVAKKQNVRQYIHSSLQIGVSFGAFPFHFSSKKTQHNVQKQKTVHIAVTDSDVIFAVVPAAAPWGRVGHPGGLVLLLFGWTAGAQHGPSDYQECSCSKSDVQ